MSKATKIKLLLVLAFFVILILLGWFVLTEENVDIIVCVFRNDDLTNDQIQDKLSQLGIRGNITIAILSMLQVVLTFLPSEPTQVLAGLTYGFWHGLACCMVGVFVGNTIIFALYKLFGDRLNAYFDKELHVNINKLSNSRIITIVVAILYLLPVIPYGMICFFAATMRMKYPKYITSTVLLSTPSVAIGVLLGHTALATSWKVSLAIFIILVLLIIVFVIKKKAFFAWLNDYIDNSRDVMSGRFTVKSYHRRNLRLPFFISRILMFGKVKVKYNYKVKDIEKPSITLVNHGSFIDFAYAGAMLRKHAPNFVVARLYFYKKLYRNFLRNFGCFPKSMFCADLESAKNCLQVLKRGRALAMMPEARLSTVGRFEDIQEGTYAFLKKAGVTVYSIKLEGDYFARPKWGDKMRKGAYVEATLDTLISKEELSELSVEQIKERVEKALYFDEFEWLKQHPEIHYKSKTLAVGLENIINHCPACNEKYTIRTKGNDVYCEKCGMKLTLNDRYGFEPNEYFENFAMWYDWQKEEYRRMMMDESFALVSRVELKNNAKDGKRALYTAGHGVCTLNREGLTYVGTRDGVEITKHFPLNDIYRLLFGAGEDFEIYEGKEIYYFIPEEKRSCVDWYIVSGLLKEPVALEV